MFKAEIIADSINPLGERLTTMVVTFPRIVLAEFNTHRAFSRNSASSRAIPFEKMVKSVEENPFIPIVWQKDHKGMQGTEYITSRDEIEPRINDWLDARNDAVKRAKYLNEMGVTKQLCNRLLEPFMWHTVIVTATDWENFFALRCPQYEYSVATFRSKKDLAKSTVHAENFTEDDWRRMNKSQAEIHIQAIAELMWDSINESIPKQLQEDEWHIPFGDSIDEDKAVTVWWNFTGDEQAKSHEDAFNKVKVKIATARCARVSYTVVGEESKEPNYENDIKLHDRLLESGHMSPFEHCAQVVSLIPKAKGKLSGNFNSIGWVQYRKTIPGECKTK